MAFKLPFQKGKNNSDGSLNCHGLPLFAWEQLREKEEVTGRGSYLRKALLPMVWFLWRETILRRW